MEINTAPSEISFDEITGRVKKELGLLKQWHGFFNISAQLCATVSQVLVSVQGESPADAGYASTLQFALKNVRSEMKELQAETMEAHLSLLRDVVSPLDQFAEHYEDHSHAVYSSGRSLLDQVAELKSQAEKRKSDYFSNEATLEKALQERKEKNEVPTADELSIELAHGMCRGDSRAQGSHAG